ncbi:MAG: hypothetical protein P8R32_01375 [Candidatus Poseidoniia archaeon]|nr:hypothetical protein [Candidatus Poseidoniia archaeon]
MDAVNISEKNPSYSFLGKNHRIFIEGRGFDFDSFNVYNDSTASLNLINLEDPLFTILDFQEPRVIYVVSKLGQNDLILQGCIFNSIDGKESHLSYSKIQAES